MLKLIYQLFFESAEEKTARLKQEHEIHEKEREVLKIGRFNTGDTVKVICPDSPDEIGIINRLIKDWWYHDELELDFSTAYIRLRNGELVQRWITDIELLDNLLIM